jgi:hypothetical protein
MGPMLQYPILQTLLSPFRRSQQQTLALVIAAIAEGAQASSLAVAGHLAVERGTQLGRALTHFYRLLRNPRVDDQQLTAPRLQLLGHGPRPLIALDWTEWHHDPRRLVAAVGQAMVQVAPRCGSPVSAKAPVCRCCGSASRL